MKFILRKLSLLWLFLVAIFIPGNANSASKNNLKERINKVRKTIKENRNQTNLIQFNDNKFDKDNLDQWNNWRKWSNWKKWRNT